MNESVTPADLWHAMDVEDLAGTRLGRAALSLSEAEERLEEEPGDEGLRADVAAWRERYTVAETAAREARERRLRIETHLGEHETQRVYAQRYGR